VETNCLLGRAAPRFSPRDPQETGDSSKSGPDSPPQWQTPAAQESGVRTENLQGELGSRLYDESGRNAQYGFHQQVEMSNWPSPSSQGSAGEISEDLERRGSKLVNKKTGRVLQTNLATEARQGSPKRLNPVFVSWLMGFPLNWQDPHTSIAQTSYDFWVTQSVRRLEHLLSSS
jgi:hypothetical protein